VEGGRRGRLDGVRGGPARRAGYRGLANAAPKSRIPGSGVLIFAAEREDFIVQPFLLSVVGVVVGGTLAGVTLIGVIQSQTDGPANSPANVSNPVIDYGTNQ